MPSTQRQARRPSAFSIAYSIVPASTSPFHGEVIPAASAFGSTG